MALFRPTLVKLEKNDALTNQPMAGEPSAERRGQLLELGLELGRGRVPSGGLGQQVFSQLELRAAVVQTHRTRVAIAIPTPITISGPATSGLATAAVVVAGDVTVRCRGEEEHLR